MTNTFISHEEIEALLRDNPSGDHTGAESMPVEPNQMAGVSEAGRPDPKPVLDTKAFNSPNLDLILDIPLKLTVLLGKTKRPISEVLKLTKGSIIELDRLENEPVDILVNDTLIARGEVVVVREYFGIRITDIISTEKRIRSLVST